MSGFSREIRLSEWGSAFGDLPCYFIRKGVGSRAEDQESRKCEFNPQVLLHVFPVFRGSLRIDVCRIVPAPTFRRGNLRGGSAPHGALGAIQDLQRLRSPRTKKQKEPNWRKRTKNHDSILFRKVLSYSILTSLKAVTSVCDTCRLRRR